MDKIKQWVALTVVGVLAVVAGGWFLLVSPKRSEAADIRLDVDQTEQEVTALKSQLDMLKAQQKTLPQVQARLSKVQTQIPDNSAMPSLIRALGAAAERAGVQLVSLAPALPTPMQAAATARTARPTSATGDETSGSTSTAPRPATVPQSAGVTAGVLNEIKISVNVVGGYFQIQQFFDQVESLKRAMKVTGFTLGTGSKVMPASAAAAGGTGGGSSAAGAGYTGVLAANISALVYMADGRKISTTAVAAK